MDEILRMLGKVKNQLKQANVSMSTLRQEIHTAQNVVDQIGNAIKSELAANTRPVGMDDMEYLELRVGELYSEVGALLTQQRAKQAPPPRNAHRIQAPANPATKPSAESASAGGFRCSEKDIYTSADAPN